MLQAKIQRAAQEFVASGMHLSDEHYEELADATVARIARGTIWKHGDLRDDFDFYVMEELQGSIADPVYEDEF